MKLGTICAICISEERGTKKNQVPSARLIEDWGLKGDAHAGHWHRQVSLLGLREIEAFRARGARIEFGDFGENLVIEGYCLRSLPVGTKLSAGEALLEITQIGKACHSHCEIYKVMGDCIMPREGVFARVLRGGMIAVGDEIRVVEAQ